MDFKSKILYFMFRLPPTITSKEERKQGTTDSEKPKLSEWDSTNSNKVSDPQTALKLGNLKMKSNYDYN